MTDWAAIGAVMQGVGGIAAAIAVVVVAKIGVQKLSDFRDKKLEEMRIEKQVAVAERALTAAYLARRSLHATKLPYSKTQGPWEMSDKPTADGRLFANHVGELVVDRYKSHQSDWNELLAVMPSASIIFGKDVEKCLEAINKQVEFVREAADELARLEEHDKAVVHELSRRVRRWDEDPIECEIGRQIAGLEETLLPVFQDNYGRATANPIRRAGDAS